MADRRSATRRLAPPRAPPRCAGVMVREVVNFSSFWRSSTFSSTVDPTIYLLAFGFGFGSLVSTVARLRLHRLRRHRDRRHDGAVLRRLPRDVLDVRQVRVPAHLRRDPRRAGRHRGARHRRGAVDRGADRRLRLRADARRRWSSGSTRAGGCCSCRSSPRSPGYGWACFGIFIAAKAKAIESFSYWQSGLLTPMFLVAGTFFPLDQLPAVGAGARQPQPAVPLRPARARTPCSASWAGRTSATSRSWSASRSSSWRLAIRYMERRLIL